MSSRYQQLYSIPAGFPALLKGFAREILRAQPDNLFEFGAKYFDELLHKREMKDLKEAQATAYGGVDFGDPAKLQELIMTTFLEADTDGSGYLNRKEFMRCLQAANLGLTKKDIRLIMEEADEDGDGYISYSEFVAVATEVLQAIRAKAKAAEEAMVRDAELSIQAEEILVNGMTEDQLRGIMREVFKRADANGNGTLSRKEFRKALMSADLGLKRTDINLLMAVADEDNSGDISYEEFIPIVFGVLVEKIRRELAQNSDLYNLDALGEHLLADLERFDETGDGHCDKRTLKKAMKLISKEWIGLTRIQLSSILSLPEADRDETGLVNLRAFIPAAASALQGMVVVEKQRQRAQALAKVAQTEGARMLSQLDPETIKSVLLEAFIAHDADGSGALDPREAEQLLRTVGTEQLGLNHRQVEALMAAMDEDDDGLIYYSELENFFVQVLEAVLVEDALVQGGSGYEQEEGGYAGEGGFAEEGEGEEAAQQEEAYGEGEGEGEGEYQEGGDASYEAEAEGGAPEGDASFGGAAPEESGPAGGDSYYAEAEQEGGEEEAAAEAEPSAAGGEYPAEGEEREEGGPAGEYSEAPAEEEGEAEEGEPPAEAED